MIFEFFSFVILRTQKIHKYGKKIENIIDLDFDGDSKIKFFMIFKIIDANISKRYTYESSNSEEACYIVAKINFLL